MEHDEGGEGGGEETVRSTVREVGQRGGLEEASGC